MSRPQRLTLSGLLVLVAAATAGLILTRGTARLGKRAVKSNLSAAAQALVAHEQLLDTAQSVATLAVTPKELDLARNALRLADRELDLAFTDALQAASEHPTATTGAARALQAQIASYNADIDALQDEIKSLTAAEAHAKGQRLSALEQQLDLAQAQLGLDQDSLADAQEDLARVGGDAHSEIQRLWQQHEATEHAKETAPGANSQGPAAAAPAASSVISQWRNWRAVHQAHLQLIQAREEALQVASTVTLDHAALEKKAETKTQQPASPPAAATTSPGAAGSTNDAAAHIAALHRLSLRKKHLADLDRRILDLHELSGTYDQWTSVSNGHERAALHRLILSALYILLTALVVLLVSHLSEHAFSRAGQERRSLMTLRGVVRFAVEALGIATVLLVIFGLPANLSTVLGLAGAGLTVALKDFIVSFIGWFSLMGRLGIRVGDWVEINGVRGEVIQLDMLHTILLETGNWTEPGHPTGRRVTFLNSYAVEGYYFNFTTAGRWLWDEITLHIPRGVDPYPIIQQIESVVGAETGPSAKIAEEEWQRATRGHSVKSFTAAPAINVRSTVAGVELTLRYITRANERPGLRLRLSNAAVKLVHEAKPTATQAQHPATQPPEEARPSSPAPKNL